MTASQASSLADARQQRSGVGLGSGCSPNKVLLLPCKRLRARRTAVLPKAQVVHELFKHAATTKPAVSAALGIVSNDQLYRHAPRLSDVVNMLFIVAAAFGSFAILVAKYIYESNLRKEQYLREATAEDLPVHLLYGVDVTGSKYLGRPEVVRAADFAAKAHAHQKRRTGEPYVSHCIATAKIVEGLVASFHTQVADERAETAIKAALVHDVVDDTQHDLAEIRERLGSPVADIVHHVSRLSDVNQLLRRQLRHEAVQKGAGVGPAQRLSTEEEEALTSMILSLVDEPLVLAVKLADRLHNMRTCHVLKPDRRTAVATETLQVWCGLAERLGMFSLKAELEDLSFAVLQPQEYRKVRSQLDSQWGVHSLKPANTQETQPSLHMQPSLEKQSSSKAPVLKLASPPRKPSVRNPAGVQALGDVFFSFEQLMAWEGRADSPLSQQAGGTALAQQPGGTARALQPTTALLDRVREDDEGRAKDLSGCSTAVLCPPAGMHMDNGLIARFRGPMPVKIGSSQELEQARRMGVVLSPNFDPDVLPGLSIGKRRRPLTSKYERTAARNSRRTSLKLPPVKKADSKTPSADSLVLSSQDGGGTAGGTAASAAGDTAFRNDCGTAERTARSHLTQEQHEVGELLASVAPFDAKLYGSPQCALPSAWPALKALQECARGLGNELRLSNVAVGLDLDVQGRLESAYSVHRKMLRKKVPLFQVYDARALRIMVDDENGLMMQDAVEACYEAMRVVQRIWKNIPSEYDDYIANPTASGYQSLHAAVTGPGGLPMEVQIRTSSMHLMAEYGAAAHWAYKDSASNNGSPASRRLQEGQPVMRSDGGKLQLGVIVSVDSGAQQHSLLVAVKNGSRLLPGAPIAPESCRELLEYVASHDWRRAGAGDWNVRLEDCSLCNDGKFHIVDRFGRRQHATATPIYGWPSEPADAKTLLPAASAKPALPPPKWIGQLSSSQDQLDVREHLSRSMSAVNDDSAASQQRIKHRQSGSRSAWLSKRSKMWQQRREQQDKMSSEDLAYANILPAPKQKGNAAKIRSLRQKLENTPLGAEVESAARAESSLKDHISVFVWPTAKVAALPHGTTAGQVLSTRGAIEICEEGVEPLEGLVNVNNKLVPDNTPLQNGDYIVLARHLININRH